MKSIIRQRDTAALIMNRVIIDGKTIDLWLNPWINHKSLVDIIRRNKIYLHNTASSTVSHITRDGQFQPQLLSETREAATRIK